MSNQQKIRIGIVGAGANTRTMHIPCFQALEGVEITAVCNRSRASSEKVAAEFGIPITFDDWKKLVSSDEIDAVCIGTGPSLHCPVTVAALGHGKHVLCEARMAMNAEEAGQMLSASKKNPKLLAQLVPAPFTLPLDAMIVSLIQSGFPGEILSVDLRAYQGAFIDNDSPLHWRQDERLSGFNTLTLGIWYETLMRWIGPAKNVMARGQVFVKERKDAGGKKHTIKIPDHLDVIAEMECGAQAVLRFSAVTGFAPSPEVWIYGSAGTLKIDVTSQTLYGGKRGDQVLKEIAIPEKDRGFWRVEEEFINAIRGIEKVKLTTFEDGYRYMEFTEAVDRSSREGCVVNLQGP